MKIFSAIKLSAFRSLKTWKGVLIVWLLSLILVSMVALPIKGVFKSGLGNSMITEQLKQGINLEVFTDLGTTFKGLVSFFKTGLFMAIVIGFLLNVFLTGGLFSAIKSSAGKFSVAEFFSASAKNFWSFLVILLIISAIILFLGILIIVIPLVVVGQADGPTEGIMMKTALITFSVFFLLLVVMLLVADYARAWQVLNDKSGYFRAIGFGFKQTFRTFFFSYSLMLILLLFQLLYGWLVLSILPGITPVSGIGVFLLFLLSQLMLIIKIMLKVLRYGSVTTMMEQKRQ